MATAVKASIWKGFLYKQINETKIKEYILGHEIENAVESINKRIGEGFSY